MALVRMKRALVIGCGELGLHISAELSNARYAVTVIDRDPQAFAGLPTAFGGETVLADGADVSVLKESDIESTYVFVACTDRDSINYFLARVASEIYGVEHVFARIEDEDLIGLLEESVIEIICPHRLCLDVFRHAMRLS